MKYSLLDNRKVWAYKISISCAQRKVFVSDNFNPPHMSASSSELSPQSSLPSQTHVCSLHNVLLQMNSSARQKKAPEITSVSCQDLWITLCTKKNIAASETSALKYVDSWSAPVFFASWIISRTLVAVFLVTVVHAVKHVIAAPAPRDAVSAVQTKELILPALLHAANLPGKNSSYLWNATSVPR